MINVNNTLLIGIDIQEKLTPILGKNTGVIVENSKKLLTAAKILNVETILTEQYKKGLGETIKEVKESVLENTPIFDKTEFSIVKNEEIFKYIKNSNKKQIILFGIESHICVYQSALELFESGYEVFVVDNASFSRSEYEKETAFKNLSLIGIDILTVENIIFTWLQTSKNLHFKEVQSLIK